MFGAIVGLLSAALSLWDDKEKNKYIDKLLQLQKDYYAEDNKPDDQRDDAVLDNLTFELKILSDAFVSNVTRSRTAQ